MTNGQAMDIGALKAALATLGNEDGGFRLPGELRVREMRRSLDALAIWQIVQIVAGIAISIAGGMVWSDLVAQPGLLFASGLLVNFYGAAMIGLGIAGLAQALRIDVAAPIVETEGHMARLHRIKLVSGWVLGLSWWVLWLPFAAIAVRLLTGADMLAPIGASAWVGVTLASGLAGWAGMWGLRRWAIRSGRKQLAARMDDMLTGRSFRDARQRLDEAAKFAAG